MKIVHIATTDFGGAYKAVERIQGCMRTYGLDSEILVRSRFFDTDTIEVIDTPLKRLISKGKNFCNLLLSHDEVITDLFGADITKHPKVHEADIIILHWVNSFISATSIRRLKRLQKPIIWVMHDMWPFTGGCHYDAYCERYMNECGQCPFIKHKRKRDISFWNLQNKHKLYSDVNISFVAISMWEMQCARASKPLQSKSISWISNPVNTDVFRPLDRNAIRDRLDIAEKKIILFGADKALENKTKGFRYLLEALQYIDGTQYAAVCFGQAPEGDRVSLPNMDLIYLGNIRDESILVQWYNAADVFVAPSLQEAFGYTVCEALSCGTPVTAFAVGGMLDQIEHQRNGYLAKLYDSQDLAEGIVYCVGNRERLGHAARERVVSNNSYRVISEQYYQLCRQLLEESRMK